MRPFVIDTNVLYLANAPLRASRACEAECARKLLEIKQSGIVVLDSSRLILKEYRGFEQKTGQPGAGIRFLRWLLQNGKRTKSVTITHHSMRGFEQFPEHAGLEAFDDSDRKFVAVACAHGESPPILQAADSKWWGWKAALDECGVKVDFLCPEEIEAMHTKKMGPA
jgi:hypothetical protein